MKQATFKASEHTLMIEAYLKTLNAGDRVSYETIAQESAVPMDTKGKSYLRTAANRLNIEYSSIRGQGIELCSEMNATGMIATRVQRIDKSVKRADKTTKRVTDQFYEKLSNEDKQHVNVVASMFGAIRAYSNNARLLFKKPIVKLSN